MTPTRYRLLQVSLATALGAALAAGPAMAQKSDSIPGGVEHKPGLSLDGVGKGGGGTSRGLGLSSPPPAPAPAATAPAAELARPAAPATTAAPVEAKPADKQPAAETKSSSGKKKKKSSKRSYHYEKAPARSAPGAGRDDIPGGVEHKPTPPSGQP